jgi:hypothetical protein
LAVPASLVLPPFDAPTETLEEAVQEQMDFAAQLKLLRRQNAQLAQRQDRLAEMFAKRDADIERIANNQTVVHSNTELLITQMRKLAKHLGVSNG